VSEGQEPALAGALGARRRATLWAFRAGLTTWRCSIVTLDLAEGTSALALPSSGTTIRSWIDQGLVLGMGSTSSFRESSSSGLRLSAPAGTRAAHACRPDRPGRRAQAMRIPVSAQPPWRACRAAVLRNIDYVNARNARSRVKFRLLLDDDWYQRSSLSHLEHTPARLPDASTRCRAKATSQRDGGYVASRLAAGA